MAGLKPLFDNSWFWIFQIIVGIICLLFAAAVLLYGVTSLLSGSTELAAAYIWLFLAGVGLMILGAERIVSGLTAKGVKKSSRILNIAVGSGLIVYIGSGFFFPEVATKWLIIFLGFGLLANGIIRIVKGLKKKYEEQYDYSSLSLGIMITSLSILVLTYQQLGLALLVVMTAVALAVSGIQVVLAGIKGGKERRREKTGKGEIAEDHKEENNKIYQPILKKEKGFWKDGTWFRDEVGRFVIFRGVNFGGRSKLPPYLPIASLDTKELQTLDLKAEIESVKPALDLLRTSGFNVVRLLISWKALEPSPNPKIESDLLPEGQQYLSSMNIIINELYLRNIFVILDFHQDIANEAYGGDGFPDWAIAIDSENPKPPVSKGPDKKWQVKYVLNKSLKHTFKSFWENDLTNTNEDLVHYPVRTHLERTIGLSIKFLKSLQGGNTHPAIIGIEPFNEPHPGLIDKSIFESKYLMDFYTNVNNEIKKVDDNLSIFIEPRVDWTVSSEGGGSPISYGASPLALKQSFNMDFIKKLMADRKLVSKKLTTYLPKDEYSMSNFDSNGVLSFHYYDPMAIASSFVSIPESMYTYKKEFPEIFGQLAIASLERKLIPFLTEFGAFQEGEQVRDYLDLQYNQIEAFLFNSTIWNYDLYNTEKGKDNWNLENYSLLGPERTPRNMDVVTRPYPMRSSAEPIELFFDIESKYVVIGLRGKVITDEPTVIYVPYNLHYFPQFTVWTTHSKRIKWDKANQLLYWYPSKRMKENYLIITKGKITGSTFDNAPQRVKDTAGKTRTLVVSNFE